MFVLELVYTAELERIDEAMARHRRWLCGQVEAGVFLAAGRKVPREGGVILAAGEDRAAIEALVATDPFVREGLTEYRITQFAATVTAPALDGHRERPPV
ncbi:YciI family protein [Kitasatospora sp. NPDC018058]|uniref:YciI family protein n=1 Tax=Kitasatospora sp. NPDC018058 TaxID=3364025 RepID=UPI0037BED50F